jgi:hypothetical protein
LLVILAQAAIAAEPGECALDYPAPRQYGKAGALRPPDDDGTTAVQLLAGSVETGALVSAVAVDQAQSPQCPRDAFKQQRSPRLLLDVGGMHQHRQQVAQRVDQDVPLATLYALRRIPAARPPFSVVFTLWLSITAALGLASRPAASRAAMRSTASTSSHTPAAIHARRYA